MTTKIQKRKQSTGDHLQPRAAARGLGGGPGGGGGGLPPGARHRPQVDSALFIIII